MILVEIIILIIVLLLLSRLKEKVYLYNTLTSLILVLAVIQSPLFYLYGTGMLGFFALVFYSFLGLCLSVWLLFKYKKDLSVKTKFHKYGLYFAIILGIGSFFWGNRIVEHIDWKLRRKAREEIVLKSNNYKPGLHTYKPEEWTSFPISNGGNEVIIEKGIKGELTVQFYTDRGFIDHYSAFVYTNDPKRIKEYGKDSYIDKNWYYISK